MNNSLMLPVHFSLELRGHVGREQEVTCWLLYEMCENRFCFEFTIVCTFVLLAARKHTGKIRHASSSPRSSKSSKSELSPPKKPKLDNGRNSSTNGDKVKAESGAAEPEAKMETVNEVGDGSLEPMEVEEDEVTDTSKERGGELSLTELTVPRTYRHHNKANAITSVQMPLLG